MKIVEYFGVCATDVLQIVIQLHRIQRTENIGSFFEKVQYEDLTPRKPSSIVITAKLGVKSANKC